ncbi:MAG: CHAD domain-containing protein [Planctomycetes bacterium]|jgi:CHAD domain-containing protein|nr:CHAD domain-containing protein [Planctomycetota bacterium]
MARRRTTPSRRAPVAPQSATAFALDAIARLTGDLQGHLAGLASTTAPESVHGTRVTCRRLRAVLALFRPVIAGGDDAIDALRALARGLADLRATDVFLARLHDSGLPELAEVGRGLAARRDELATAARKNGATREAALAALAALAPHPRAGDNLTHLLGERLYRVRRRFRRAFKRARARHTADNAHALRLRAKKLRYALECAGNTGGKSGARAAEALRRLQDELGRWLDARDAAAQARAAGVAAPAAGALARRFGAEAARLRRELPELLRRFERRDWPLIKKAVPRMKEATP